MSYLYNLIFYRPLLNLLVFLYNSVAWQDLGIAIILCTIVIRLILFPLFQKSAMHQTVMQRLQPHIKKIQEEHKNDREKQGQQMMALFQEHKVNPFSGFVFLILQMPIIIALYQIVINIFKPEILNNLYSFVARPDHIDPYFFGLINLSESNIVMVVLAAAGQFLQGWYSMRAGGTGKLNGQQLTTLMLAPVLTLFIFYSFKFPNAVSLYWAVSSAFSIAQQIYINKKLNNGELGRIS